MEYLQKVYEFFTNNRGIGKAPRSGSEPHYRPSIWNQEEHIKSHNCYSYFLDDIKENQFSKPQPGKYSGLKKDYSSCDSMVKRVLADNPDIQLASAESSCPNGFYKGFLALDRGKDYHFYRQDSNGFFSHKRGRNPVSNKDASGNFIVQPHDSNRDFGDYNYASTCGYLCVPSNNFKNTRSK